MKVSGPKELIGDRSHLLSAFIVCGDLRGDSRSYSTELLRVLPQDLKEASVWQDKLTGLWRYEYGLPFEKLPNNNIVTGTNVFLPVDELYDSIRLADKYLTKQQLLDFLGRLADRGKHEDVLFEMRPVLHVKGNPSIRYEVSGYGLGNTTCDWAIGYFAHRIVLDVKNRTRSLVNQLAAISASLKELERPPKLPAPDPQDLFRSAERKFRRRPPFSHLQGLWIHSSIKEDEEKLKSYFESSLDSRKIHFAILSDWKDDAYILARNSILREYLEATFCLVPSNRFTSADYEKRF
jgi:hypothetical protein